MGVESRRQGQLVLVLDDAEEAPLRRRRRDNALVSNSRPFFRIAAPKLRLDEAIEPPGFAAQVTQAAERRSPGLRRGGFAGSERDTGSIFAGFPVEHDGERQGSGIAGEGGQEKALAVDVVGVVVTRPKSRR